MNRRPASKRDVPERIGARARGGLLVLLAAVTWTGGRHALAAEPTLETPRQRALNFLTDLHRRHLGSSDWIARAAAVIGLSRMPTDAATEILLQQAQTETHPVGRLVAWQAVLARAGRVTDEQFRAWDTATSAMVRKDLFHGDLRIGLLEMLGATPVTPEKRRYFLGLFRRASSLDSSDIPTLIAMGRALGQWRDSDLIESLLRCMGSANTAIRAELVLQAAGVEMPWVRAPSAQRVYRQWWQENKETFAAAAAAPRAWRKLRPQFIPAPLEAKAFDPLDPKWRREMELGRLRLSQFSFAIAVDCSRSMRPEIDRLKRDMRIMFTAFGQIAREVGVGVTLFSPGAIVRYLRLTGDPKRLMAYVDAAGIMGPAGEEEWAGALERTIKGNRWPARGKYSRRAIVLLSDEPITDPQFRRAMPLARASGKAGFRIYGVMIRSLQRVPNNPLSVPFDRTSGGSVFAEDDTAPSPAGAGGRAGRKGKRKGGGNAQKPGRSWAYYDDLTRATGGRAIDVYVPQGGLGLGYPPGMAAPAARKQPGKKNRPGGKQQVKVDPMAIAPIYPGGGPTSRILTLVLTDAINPLHAERIEPLVKILVAYCQKAAARIPERRRWGKPEPMEPNRQVD